MRRLLTGVLVGLALALLPVGASAASPSTITEYLNGVETGIPPPCLGGSTSPFSGTAQGPLQGVWWASICHTALGMSAEILGGDFGLRTPSRLLEGKFLAKQGSVQWKDEGHFWGTCWQHYTVNGLLTNGTFNATLTHYGAYYSGSCHVYSARVSGTATLNV